MAKFFMWLIGFTLFATSIPINEPLSARTGAQRVDCSKIKKRSKRRRCQRAQIRLLQEDNRGRDEVIRHSERQSTKVDCAAMAAQIAVGQASGLQGLVVHAKKTLINSTANAARSYAARNERTCIRWVKNHFWGKAKKCERWLERNGVSVMKNRRPYNTLTRRYVSGAPSYCGW